MYAVIAQKTSIYVMNVRIPSRPVSLIVHHFTLNWNCLFPLHLLKLFEIIQLNLFLLFSFSLYYSQYTQLVKLADKYFSLCEQIQKFASCVSETFKQFAETIRKQREKQGNQQNKVKLVPQALKLQQQQGHGNTGLMNQNGVVNHQNMRPGGNTPSDQQRRQNLYSGQMNTMRSPQALVSQNPNVQARPQNSFSLFIQEKRRQILIGNPSLQFVNVTRQLTQQWKQMNDQQKRPYIERYQQMKKRQIVPGGSNIQQPPNNITGGNDLTGVETKTNREKQVPVNNNSQFKGENDVIQSEIRLKPQRPVVYQEDDQDDGIFDDMLPEAEKFRKAQIKKSKLRQKEQQRLKALNDFRVQQGNEIELQQSKQQNPESIKFQQDQQSIQKQSPSKDSHHAPVSARHAQQIDNVDDLLNNRIIEEQKYSAQQIKARRISTYGGQENEHNQNNQNWGGQEITGKTLGDGKHDKAIKNEEKEPSIQLVQSQSDDRYSGTHPHSGLNQSVTQTPQFHRLTPGENMQSETLQIDDLQPKLQQNPSSHPRRQQRVMGPSQQPIGNTPSLIVGTGQYDQINFSQLNN